MLKGLLAQVEPVCNYLTSEKQTEIDFSITQAQLFETFKAEYDANPQMNNTKDTAKGDMLNALRESLKQQATLDESKSSKKAMKSLQKSLKSLSKQKTKSPNKTPDEVKSPEVLSGNGTTNKKDEEGGELETQGKFNRNSNRSMGFSVAGSSLYGQSVFKT